MFYTTKYEIVLTTVHFVTYIWKITLHLQISLKVIIDFSYFLQTRNKSSTFAKELGKSR